MSNKLPMPEPGFTVEETQAYDRGVKEGRELGFNASNPFDYEKKHSCWEAYESGKSLGICDRNFESKQTMNTLLGNRLLVRPVNQPEGEIVGKIHVPDKFKPKGLTEMVVVKLGNGPKVPAEIKAGANVWIDERMGNVKLADGNIIVSTEDVLAMRTEGVE